MKCLSNKHWAAYLADPSGPEFENHLSRCDSCRQKAIGYKRLVSVLHDSKPAEPRPEYWQNLKRSIMNSLVSEEPGRSWWWFLGSAPLLRPALAGAGLCLAITAFLLWPIHDRQAPQLQAPAESLAAWLVESGETGVLQAEHVKWAEESNWKPAEIAAYVETTIPVEEILADLSQEEIEVLDRQISRRVL